MDSCPRVRHAGQSFKGKPAMQRQEGQGLIQQVRADHPTTDTPTHGQDDEHPGWEAVNALNVSSSGRCLVAALFQVGLRHSLSLSTSSSRQFLHPLPPKNETVSLLSVCVCHAAEPPCVPAGTETGGHAGTWHWTLISKATVARDLRCSAPQSCAQQVTTGCVMRR